MKVRLHSLQLWVYVHATLLFLVRPIRTLVTGRSNLIDELDYGLYFGVWMFSLLSVGIFFYFFRTLRFPALVEQDEADKISVSRFFFALVVWFMVWALLLRSRFQEGDLLMLLDSSSDYIHGKSIFLLNTTTMLVGFFIIKSYSLRSPPTIRAIIRWSLVLMGMAAGVVSGSKTLALYPLFIMLLYRSMAKDGFPLWGVGLTVICSLPIVVVLNAVRGGGVGSVGDVFSSGDFLFELLPGFLERYYGVDVIYEIVRHHTFLNKEYFYGSSLLQIIYAFIPSAVWADKPVISFGKIISDEYLPPIFRGLGISAAPTLFGELFANFSWASLVFVPFFAAAFSKHIQSIRRNVRFAQKHHLEYYLISFTTLAFVLEVSIVGWLVQLLALYGAIYLLNFLVTADQKRIFKSL